MLLNLNPTCGHFHGKKKSRFKQLKEEENRTKLKQALPTEERLPLASTDSDDESVGESNNKVPLSLLPFVYLFRQVQCASVMLNLITKPPSKIY